AYVSASAGMEVVLLDTTLEKANAGKEHSKVLLQERVEKGKLDSGEAAATMKRIESTDSYDRLQGCELVIEAVFEDRKIKADVTAKAESVIPADAIFASNTSTLPISGVAKASRRPGTFIVINFITPVEKMPLVEVIVREATSYTTVSQALDYVQQVCETPILVNDSRVFYTSRVFSVYSREG